MTSEILPLELDTTTRPDDDIAALIHAAALAGREFTEPQGPNRIPSFVASDGRIALAILKAARARLPLQGNRFVEWGSGLGLVSCMAQRLGWQATGIDRDPRLVAAARALANAHRCKARFIEASYTPPGFHEKSVSAADAGRKTAGVGLFDFDLIYVFAWPSELAPILSLFSDHARPGTVLLAYRGGLQITAHRAT